MPADFNGYWKMLSNENFEEYLKALGKIFFHFFLLFEPQVELYDFIRYAICMKVFLAASFFIDIALVTK